MRKADHLGSIQLGVLSIEYLILDPLRLEEGVFPPSFPQGGRGFWGVSDQLTKRVSE